MTTKKKNLFYNFVMLKVVPAILKRWYVDKPKSPSTMEEKWHWNRDGYFMWYKYAIRKYWERGDYIGVIICAIVCLWHKRGKLK